MPTVVAPGQGLAVENPVGGVMTFKATASETAGVLTAIDTIAAPGEGPPLHVHAEDELIYTLEGRFRVKLGDTIQPAEPGSFVFIPGGTPHTWQNVGDQPARFFATIMPAATAFEKFFRLYAELPVDERGVEAFARLRRRDERVRRGWPAARGVRSALDQRRTMLPNEPPAVAPVVHPALSASLLGCGERPELLAEQGA